MDWPSFFIGYACGALATVLAYFPITRAKRRADILRQIREHKNSFSHE